MVPSVRINHPSMKTLLQINPVMRISTSTGRIMQEIGELAMRHGWRSCIAYAKGRDGGNPSCLSQLIPVGNAWSTCWHGIQTRMLDRHGLASTGATKQFIRQIEQIRPDVVHIHNIHGYFLNYRVLFDYLSRSGIPVVWTVHDCWLYTGHCYYYSYAACDRWQTECHDCPQRREFPTSLLADRSRKNFRDKRAAFTSMPRNRLTVVPVSEWIGAEMQRSFLAGYDFRMIHNGIDTEVFRMRETREVRERYGLGEKHILLGVASIWSREKGLDDFLHMARMLNDDELIVLVGIKPAEKRRLPRNIVGIPRTEHIRQLAELYSTADVFINPTWQDNYPTVNMEAIACGTPVVTYRTGGSVEAVTEDTGRIVEQGDCRGLLEAARNMRQQRRELVRTHCRAYALKHFNKEDRYAEYLDLYDELMMRG